MIRTSSSSGFALVIALGIMSFIVLLLLSIATFVRVESQSAAIALRQLQARQNAMLGAMIAVGELQRTTGPDQRVTATAGLVRPAAVTDESALQSHWTGAWTTDDPVERRPQLLRWLVSSATPETLDPLALANSGNDSASDHIWLVRNAATIDPETPTAEDRSRWVQVPTMDISRNGSTDGRFAWWVGDVGVKAGVNIGELPETLDPNLAARARLNFQVAQKAGLEGLDNTRYPGLAGWPASFGSRERFRHLRDLPLDDSLGNELPRSGFHSLTGVSLGLLTDTLNGGLRRDLSAGLYDASQFSDFVSEVGRGLDGDAIYDAADLNDDGDPVPSMSNPGGPLWQQLRSYVNTSQATGTGVDTTHTFSAHRDNQHGLLPIVSRAQVFFYASCYYIPGTDVEDGDEIYQQGYRYWILPKVVFWNPYNTRIEVNEETFFRFTNQHTLSDSASVRRDTHRIYARRQNTNNPHANNSSWNNDPLSRRNGGMWVFSQGWNETGGDGEGLPLTFRIEPFSIEPGEALVFSPQQNLPYRDITSIGNAASNPDTNILVRNLFGSVDYGYYVNVNIGTNEFNGLRTINNVGRGAGDQSGAGPSRNFVRIGIRNASLQNWQWGLTPAFNSQDYLVSSHYHQWLGNHHRGESAGSEFNISYQFEAPIDGWPSAPFPGDGHWGERWESEQARLGTAVPRYDQNTFENTPLPVLYDDQRTWYYNFPDNGFMTHLRFPGSEINSDQNPDLIPRTQWLAQNNPRASFSGRSPNELFFSQTPWFNPNYVDWPIYDWSNENNPSRQADVNVNLAGRSYVGHSDDEVTGGNLRSILFHAPRAGDRFLSIAELSQANLTRHHDFWAAADLHQDVDLYAHSEGRAIPNVYDNLQPAYAIGNSIIDPRVPSDRTFLHWQTANPTQFGGIDSVQYDHSYWLNEALWDRFFFSGIPVGAALPATLPFSRLQYLGNPDDPASADSLRDFRTAAAGLAVRGAFNVNSVSVDAWRVLLTSLYGYPVQTLEGTVNNPSQSPFVRSLISGGNPASSTSAVASDENQTGFRRLNTTEISALAQAIVDELRARRGANAEDGPFLSLADAINRTPWAADLEHRRMGFLQAALNATVNQTFLNDSATYIDPGQATATYTAAQIEGSAAANIPGYLTQADLLSRIGPALAARSDTFTIRAYGQSLNTFGGSDAEAWCEIVVQRLPDYVNPNADSAETLDPTDLLNRDFGRRYAIVDFRWLTNDEI